MPDKYGSPIKPDISHARVAVGCHVGMLYCHATLHEARRAMRWLTRPRRSRPTKGSMRVPASRILQLQWSGGHRLTVMRPLALIEEDGSAAVSRTDALSPVSLHTGSISRCGARTRQRRPGCLGVVESHRGLAGLESRADHLHAVHPEQCRFDGDRACGARHARNGQRVGFLFSPNWGREHRREQHHGLHCARRGFPLAEGVSARSRSVNCRGWRTFGSEPEQELGVTQYPSACEGL